jgi:hypothetical protein
MSRAPRHAKKPKSALTLPPEHTKFNIGGAQNDARARRRRRRSRHGPLKPLCPTSPPTHPYTRSPSKYLPRQVRRGARRALGVSPRASPQTNRPRQVRGGRGPLNRHWRRGRRHPPLRDERNIRLKVTARNPRAQLRSPRPDSPGHVPAACRAQRGTVGRD